MFAVAMSALLATMVLALSRGALGPPVFDRGFLNGRPDFLDLALVYALINFIGTIAVLKYFKYGDLAETNRSDPSEDTAN